MGEYEKLDMDPIKPIKPTQIDANDTTTKFVLQGMVEERFYAKDVIDQKIINIENLIDQKLEKHKLVVAENKLTLVGKIVFTILGTVVGAIFTNIPEIIKFFTGK